MCSVKWLTETFATLMLRMMPRTTLYDDINRRSRGLLPQRLEAWKTEGWTPIDIAWFLRKYGYRVSPDTVRRWLKKMEDDEQVG